MFRHVKPPEEKAQCIGVFAASFTFMYGVDHVGVFWKCSLSPFVSVLLRSAVRSPISVISVTNMWRGANGWTRKPMPI